MAAEAKLQRFYGPAQPAITTTVLLTVADARRVTVKQILLANTAAAAKKITLAIGTAATAANQILADVSVPANTTEIFDATLVLEATETLQALQETATSISVTVSGVEEVV